MIIYHMNLGMLLGSDKYDRQQSAINPMQVLIVIVMVVGIALPIWKAWATKNYVFANIYAAVSIVVMVAAIYSKLKEKKEREYIQKNYQRLIDTAKEKAPTHTVVGRYFVDQWSKQRTEYMRWQIYEGATNTVILWEKMAILPAVEVDNHYVVFLPPGTDYYLKLSRNLDAAKGFDRFSAIQDGKEIELHYVAEKSRSARFELGTKSQKAVLEKLEGIPFVKNIYFAGKNKEEVVLIFSPDRSWKQYHQQYLATIIALVGGRYSLGRFKARAVLDIPLAPDTYDEAEAEFVRLS